MFGGKGLKFLQRAGAAKFCVPAAEPVAWIEVEGDVLGVIWNQSVGDGCCAIGAEDLRVARGGLDDAFGRGPWKNVDQTKGDEKQQALNAAGKRDANASKVACGVQVPPALLCYLKFNSKSLW